MGPENETRTEKQLRRRLIYWANQLAVSDCGKFMARFLKQGHVTIGLCAMQSRTNRRDAPGFDRRVWIMPSCGDRDGGIALSALPHAVL
jgi:hypothetical protein